jgi:hypothetical protein
MANETINGTLFVTDKIGIGINEPNEPNAQLHILSSTVAPSQAFLESGGVLLKLSVDASGASIGTANAFPLSIQTDGSSRISINSTGDITATGALAVQNNLLVNGNVGIGTSTAPTAKLEVNGTVKVNSLQIGTLTVQSVSSGTPPTNTLQVNGAVKATSFLGNGATLDGIVKKAGDTITGLLTVQNTLTVTGNVGIGTSTPSQKLEVVGTIKATAFEGNGATLSGVVKAAGDTMTGALTINNNLTVNGNVGIGTAKPRNPLGIRAIGISEELISFEDPAGNTRWHINQNLGSNKPGLNFVETSVADGRLFIQAGGNVGIGTTSPGAKLDISGGDVRWGNNSRLGIDQGGSIELGGTSSTPGSGTPYIDFHFAGLTQDFNTRIINDANGRLSLVANQVLVTGSLRQNSSRQTKKNIKNLTTTEAFKALKELNPVKFIYKKDHQENLHLGFIAEDVPDLLSADDKSSIGSLDIVAVLTKVVQEQQTTISTLTEKVEFLERQSQL